MPTLRIGHKFTKVYPSSKRRWLHSASVVVFFLATTLQPFTQTAEAAVSQQELSYATAGYVKDCGTMQGGGTDGQYLYYACAKNNKITLVKVTTDGKIVAKSDTFTRSQLGHANDITYNSKIKKLLITTWDTDVKGNKIKVIDPTTFQITDTLSTSDGGSTTSICYNAVTDQYVIAGRLYDSNLKSLGRIYTQSGVDEDAGTTKGTILNQGIECDSTYIYVMRVVARRETGYNLIAVYDWKGNNIAVYKLDLNDEGENMSMIGNTMYMGVNEGSMSSGGNPDNDYFLRVDGLGSGVRNNCGSLLLDPSTMSYSNQYKIYNHIPFTGGSLVCCNTVSSGGGLVGSTNPERVYNFLTSANISTNGGRPLTPAQASGVIGNLMVESSPDVNPKALNSNGAYGIVQWLGGRKTALEKFASSNDIEMSALETQLKFMVHELESSESAVIKDSAFKSVAHSEAGAEKAAERWDTLYERSGGAGVAKRKENAAKIFQQFAAGSPATTFQSDSTDTPNNTEQNVSAPSVGCPTASGDYVFPLKGTKEQVRSWGNDPGDDTWRSGLYHQRVYAGYYAVDIMAPQGTEVVAFHGGEVLKTDVDNHPAYNVQIKDSEGYTYFYQHLDPKRKVVKEGDTVDAGTTIGYVGDVKAAWGAAPHLHIDKSKNPGKGYRGTCTASRRNCPIADEHRFVEIVKELHNSYVKLGESGSSL